MDGRRAGLVELDKGDVARLARSRTAAEAPFVAFCEYFMSDFPFDSSIDPRTSLLLVGSLAIALGFEFVNGFHDTANAVATVIYTKSLGPRKAVAWSGFCNFLGGLPRGTAVAFGIVSLLPVELLVSVDSPRGLAMVMALLVAAIASGTWDGADGHPGVKLAHPHRLDPGCGDGQLFLRQGFGSGVNWNKAFDIGLSLLVSPLLASPSRPACSSCSRRP